MSEIIKTDICVIGAGSGGLSVAAGAVQMGARVVLVEGHKMGGDCLNYGCVPSKALLAAARHAHRPPSLDGFGLSGGVPRVNFSKTMAHVEDVIAQIAPHDSVARFEALGVKVIEAQGSFINPRTLAAGDKHIRAKRFVIATGSTPFVPPIKGLADVPYLTNETIFSLKRRPQHLLIIGGGPIGVEMAQAFARLGSKVSLFTDGGLVVREDRDLAQALTTHLETEGIALHLNALVRSVAGDKTITLKTDSKPATTHTGTHLLVAVGRTPNIARLNLAAGNIATSPHALAPHIKTDGRLRTSNKRVFAIGDAIGGPQFTHAANYQAGIVIRNILFRLPAKVNYKALPRVTYCDPELAHVGLTEMEARARYSHVQCLRRPFAENDRARAERNTQGEIKIVLGARGRILGASILGAQAGELLAPWTLALAQGLSIGAMAGVIAPYPTRGEANKHIAGSYYTPSLFSARTRKIVRFLLSVLP